MHSVDAQKVLGFSTAAVTALATVINLVDAVSSIFTSSVILTSLDTMAFLLSRIERVFG